MKKIGITGSLASGKTTASKILALKKGPLFIADQIVKKIYKTYSFKNLIKNKFNIKNNINLKKEIKRKVLKNKSNIKKLEKIIHPLVRAEMRIFIKRNRNKRFLFFEIPLLIENRLIQTR